jgi:hypothetical protein
MVAPVLDPSNKNSTVTLSNGNLTAKKTSTGNGAVTSTAAFQSTGKWYFEVTVDNRTSAGAQVPGAGTSAFDNTVYPGGNAGAGKGVGWDLIGGNILYDGGALANAGGTATVGDVVALAFDLDNHTLKTYKNNVLTSTNTIATLTVRPVVMPGDQNNNQVTTNFGGVAFTYTPPVGYIAWIDTTSSSSTVAIAVPAITLSGFAYPPYLYNAALVVPPIKIASVSSIVSNFLTVATMIAPAPVVLASELNGNVLTAKIVLPSQPGMLITASALTGEMISAALIVPLPALSVVDVNPAVIGAALSMPAARLLIAGFNGNLLTAALIARAPSLVVSGYAAYTMSAALAAPAPRVSSFMNAVALAAYRTWVLNTRKHALSEYGSEFAFNSFAIFNGQVLAAGPSGLVVLGTQGLDNAAPITARARTGQEGFGTSYHKRIPRLYVSGTFAGDMLFRTITAEGAARTYSMNYNNGVLLQQRRIPIGKGPRSRFWQFELENVAGADFSINDILVYPNTLIRRVE